MINRPFVFVANSSWYLAHYRYSLLKALLKQGYQLIAISPVDSSSEELSSLSIHIPWRIKRSQDFNLFALFKSFLKSFAIIRVIKPLLIHSHTLKANLLFSIVSSFFGIPCVLSFAGMGKLSKSKGFSLLIFKNVLKLIVFFSFHQRSSRWIWFNSPFRSIFIFQNPVDLRLFTDSIQDLPRDSCHLIYGSGVPSAYFSHDIYHNWLSTPCSDLQPHFLYCARLLRSKGILDFLEFSHSAPLDSLFSVFGEIDDSSSDSLTINELSTLKDDYSSVEFHGILKDPLLNFNSSYPVLVVPSFYGEGMPRAIAEALALCIPVICTRNSACGIFDSSTVYIIDNTSIESLVSAYSAISRDFISGILVDRLLAGRDFVLSSLSSDIVVKNTISVYDKLLSASPSSYILTKDKSNQYSWLPK